LWACDGLNYRNGEKRFCHNQKDAACLENSKAEGRKSRPALVWKNEHRKVGSLNLAGHSQGRGRKVTRSKRRAGDQNSYNQKKKGEKAEGTNTSTSKDGGGRQGRGSGRKRETRPERITTTRRGGGKIGGETCRTSRPLRRVITVKQQKRCPVPKK